MKTVASLILITNVELTKKLIRFKNIFFLVTERTFWLTQYFKRNWEGHLLHYPRDYKPHFHLVHFV